VRGGEVKRRDHMAVHGLGRVIAKGVAGGQGAEVLEGGHLFDAHYVLRVAKEMGGNVIYIIATVLYAEVGPMVQCAAGIMLTAVKWDWLSWATRQRGGTNLRYVRGGASGLTRLEYL
jgi:hypothetical protein